MTEPTVHKAVQRVVGRCKTMRDVSTISLSSRRPNRPQGTVGSDGISRYREAVCCTAKVGVYTKQSGTAESYAFVSFMQSKRLCCCMKGAFCFL